MKPTRIQIVALSVLLSCTTAFAVDSSACVPKWRRVVAVLNPLNWFPTSANATSSSRHLLADIARLNPDVKEVGRGTENQAFSVKLTTLPDGRRILNVPSGVKDAPPLAISIETKEESVVVRLPLGDRAHRERQAAVYHNEAALFAGTTPVQRVHRVKVLYDDPQGRFIVSEALNEDLFQHLKQQQHFMTNFDRIDLLRQAYQAVDELHSQGRMHGDIKPANFLLDLHQGKKILKLADFGYTAPFGSPPLGVSKGDGSYGSPSYISPLVKKDAAASLYRDAWALKILAHDILGKNVSDGPLSALALISFQNREQFETTVKLLYSNPIKNQFWSHEFGPKVLERMIQDTKDPADIDRLAFDIFQPIDSRGDKHFALAHERLRLRAVNAHLGLSTEAQAKLIASAKKQGLNTSDRVR